MNVQGLPRLGAGSRMGWKPFGPEPHPPGWRVQHPILVCVQAPGFPRAAAAGEERGSELPSGD